VNEKEIVTRVKDKFSGCFNRPHRVTSYKCSDSDDYDGEAESVEEFFSGKSWEEVDFHSVGGYLISYLTPEALLYYMPAMLIELLSTKRRFTDFEERFFSELGEPNRWGSRNEAVMNKLNQSQRNLIYEVCFMVSNREDSYNYEMFQIEEKFKC